MTKSELEVLKALSGGVRLPYIGGYERNYSRHERHEKVIKMLKREGVIYMDENNILQLGRMTCKRAN